MQLRITYFMIPSLGIMCCFAGSQQQQQQQLFNEYLRKINAELSYVQLELRACRNQYDGNVYYGVINNVSDDQSKLGTKYTVPQIAFYKGIVSFITFLHFLVHAFTMVDGNSAVS